MSIGTCAHLYQPDEVFDMNTFEGWLHCPQWRYERETQPEAEKELPQDYIPAYPWLKAATEQLRARLPKPKVKKKSLRDYLSLLSPICKEFLESDEEDEVWDSEMTHIRLCLLRSFELLEEAGSSRKLSYKEHLRYIRRIQRYAAELERQLDPNPKKGLRLVPGRLKKK